MSLRQLTGRLTIDGNQRVVAMDDGAEDILGLGRHQAVGSYCYDLVGGGGFTTNRVCGPGCGSFTTLCRGGIAGGSSVVAATGSTGGELRCRLTALPPTSEGAMVLLSVIPDEPDAAGERPDVHEPGHLVDRLAALASLLTTLADVPLSTGLERSLDLALLETGAAAAEVFLVERDTGGMVLTCHRGACLREFCERLRFDRGEGIPGRVLTRGEPIVSHPLSDDPRYLRQRVKEAGFDAYLATPLLHGGDVVGVMSLAFRHPTPDGIRQALEFVGWLGGPVGAAVHAAMVEPFASTARIGPDGFGAPTCLERLLGRLMEASDAQAGEVRLLSGEADAIGSVSKLTVGSLPGGCGPLRSGRLEDCPVLARHRSEVLYGRRDSWPEPCRSARSRGGLRLCVPLSDGERPLGLVRLWHQMPRDELPSKDLAITETIATAAAGWLGRERTLRRADRLAREMLGVLPSHGGHVDADREARGTERLGTNVRAPRLEVRCFGPFEVRIDGEALLPEAIGRKRAMTLFKVLLANRGRPVPSEALIEYLWPGHDPRVKASQLHVLVYELRRLIEPPDLANGESVGAPLPRHILSSNGGYSFAPGSTASVDEREFRTLVELSVSAEAEGDARSAVAAGEAAVELYRGDFMEDEPYADWCWQEREELRESCLDLLRRLAALAGDAGQFERSVRHLRHAIRLDPLREVNQRGLMRALWTAGRGDEALQQYRSFEEILRRELSVDPLPETRSLADRIRAGG